VLTQLPGWTQATYSRVETGEVAPAFDQLVNIYTALHKAGVVLTPQDRQEFLTLARTRIEIKKTYLEHKTDQEWDELRLHLSRFGQAAPLQKTLQDEIATRPGLLETRHLVGREDWLNSVIRSLHESFAKKLVVLQGPSGIGKSSELYRVARHFLTVAPPRPHVVLCPFPNVEEQTEPEHALDILLGSLLSETGPSDAPLQTATLTVRVAFALKYLEKCDHSVLVLVDNGEQLLDRQGHLAPCWQMFLERFLRSQHRTTLVLATKEWPGWDGTEQVFVDERMIPLLTPDESILVLQRLGLAAVLEDDLRQVSEAVGGIPLCLGWVASLVQKPLWLDSWDDMDDLSEHEHATEEVLTRRLHHLLHDPALFGGPIANRLTPLLERVIDKRLSVEAVGVLHALALAGMPLGKAALQQLCPRPSLLKELRAVSLLTAHQQRVQVLPMVASAVRSRLSSEQQRAIEEQLIEAYQHWLNEGEMSDKEMGIAIAELATLYLKQRRLLEGADLLIYYGWMSFNLGYGPRLGRLLQEIMQQYDWKSSPEGECGGLLLYYALSPFIGKAIDTKQRAMDFQRILNFCDEGQVRLKATLLMELIRVPMLYKINHDHFEEALAILTDGIAHLETYQQTDMDVQTSLLAFRAMLLAKWCNYFEEQGAIKRAFSMRQEVIALFRQCCSTITSTNEVSLPKKHLFKKRLSAYLNYLGYHLTRNGQAPEALLFLEQSIELGEQGYCNFGALASAYGDMSQALMELGRFEEALLFDEKAMTEVRRCADSGDALSLNEVWVYRVNRGRLYLQMGRIDEAEQLLKEAEPRLQPNRSVYSMLARRALKEIEQLRT